MYARRIKGINRRWGLMYHSLELRSHDKAFYQSIDSTTTIQASSLYCAPVKGRLLCLLPSLSNTLANRNIDFCARFNSYQFRGYSSEGDGRNTSEDNKHAPIGDDINIRKAREKLGSGDTKYCDAHARLAEQDQLEWLNNEKLAIESKMKASPFLIRREKFKNEFIRRILPWEKIHLSFETFPYYINEHTKDILVECVASHLKNKEVTDSYGARLKSSSGRILLQSTPGMELYRERMVKALARELQVPLLVLDGSVLAPYDLGDGSSESESDETMEDGEEQTSESEIEDENDASNEEEWTSSAEAKSDDDVVDVQATAEAALKKLIPYTLEDFEKRVSGESEGSESSKSERGHSSGASNRPLKKGDRVKYIGPSRHIEADDRPLPNGQRGEVYEVDGENVAVILDVTNDTKENKEGGENLTKELVKAPVYWLDVKDADYFISCIVKDIELDPDAEAEDCYIAIEALRDVLHSMKPLVVYFPDFSLWLSRAVPRSGRKDFVNKVQEIFDQLTGPVVLICGQNKVETGSKDKEKLTMILPNFGRLAKLPISLKHLTEGLKGTKRSSHDETSSLFTNVVSICPPKDEDLLRVFNKHVEEDRRLVILRSNLKELYEVLEENEMSCMDLLDVNADGVILNRRKAEKVVGWAKNHHLSACTLPNVKVERLFLPRESIDIAVMRLKEQENVSKRPSHNLKNLAKDEYESNFVSAVVPPGEIGVKFEDVGALEQVKKALNELVILPMKRPELFAQGNLLRPCKGILLFGPPGTGKTLLAKALATEAGANFISITGSTLTSKWFGDAEKLTKALFSFASKLAPVIIFVDEVDSLLGARGGAFEHEATRRMRNEFMAAWDGLRSKESQRILILGATNRPFDLDDAVIRRLPRRIYVDLPDAANRVKILKIFLARENIEPGFKFDELANATEGYSGSDLKNLCIAAAYRPVQELLEAENTRDKSEVAPALRPLNLNDFIQSKEKVGPSVAYDAASMNELRKWNEQYGEGGSRKKSPFGFGD